MRYYIVHIYHKDDGRIARREMTHPPAKGDWIKVKNETYVVTKVIWDFNSSMKVTLIVEELED